MSLELYFTKSWYALSIKQNLKLLHKRTSFIRKLALLLSVTLAPADWLTFTRFKQNSNNLQMFLRGRIHKHPQANFEMYS